MIEENINSIEYRHRVEVHLALSAVCVQNPSESRFCLDTQCPSLPKILLKTNQSSLKVAEKLFTDLTGASPNWLPVQQICTIDGRQDGTIIILYGITMPDKAPLLEKSVDWVDFNTLNKYPELLKLVGYACNAYRIGRTE